MAHAQKPDFVFRAKRTSPFKSARGATVQSTTGSRGVRISGSNAGYTMFRGSVKGTGYPLHSPVSPLIPLPCFTTCHHISTGVYHYTLRKIPEMNADIIYITAGTWSHAQDLYCTFYYTNDSVASNHILWGEIKVTLIPQRLTNKQL